MDQFIFFDESMRANAPVATLTLNTVGPTIMNYGSEWQKEFFLTKILAGEKPENERFPGAVATYSIEAMMQDGKALQAGTSHYLGTTFANAAGIRYQDKEGQQALCHTTSWGVSTRLIGGGIMTHGDDDGLRVPPRVAPQQVVILPMLRDNDGDEALLAYCESLRAAVARQSALGEPVRQHSGPASGWAAALTRRS